jgi:hypothetical protein
VIEPDKDASTVDLVKDALDEVRELIKLEVALAKNEIESELTRVRNAAIAMAVAAFALNLAFTMVLVALAFATGSGEIFAFIAAACLFVGAIVGVAVGMKKMPLTFLGRTRKRLGEDLKQMESHAHG